jgi:hypothetical protein
MRIGILILISWVVCSCAFPAQYRATSTVVRKMWVDKESRNCYRESLFLYFADTRCLDASIKREKDIEKYLGQADSILYNQYSKTKTYRYVSFEENICVNSSRVQRSMSIHVDVVTKKVNSITFP